MYVKGHQNNQTAPQGSEIPRSTTGNFMAIDTAETIITHRHLYINDFSFVKIKM